MDYLIACYDLDQNCFMRVVEQKDFFGLQARNHEQSLALHLIDQQSISLVSILGKSGTGKTLLALAAGLHAVLIERKFSGLVIARPTIPLGRDIGHLPW